MTDAATPEQPRTAAWELLLAELQENPLPGARHAYTVVRDRLPKILMEAQARPAVASEGLRRALEYLLANLWRYSFEYTYKDGEVDAEKQARAALARSESSDG